jgi:class 3 adenylate cyclase
MKRKIAAILAADVAGYSRLMADDEEETTRRLVSYRAVFDDFVTRADGRIVNTAGDSVLAEFPSAVDALRAAIDIQESLRTRNLSYPPSRHMVFRIGLTIGDVIEREGDLLGDGVNIAARLEALASPGGICVSRSVHEQVANKLSVIFSDLGPQNVKNIPRPVHVYRVELEKGFAEQTAVATPKPQSKPVTRFTISFVIIAALLMALGAFGSFVILNKLRQEMTKNKDAAAIASRAGVNSTDGAQPSPTVNFSTEVARSSPSLVGSPLAPGNIPFICDECRELAAKSQNIPHSALAISLSGTFWSVSSQDSAEKAQTLALENCNAVSRNNKYKCFVYAIDGQLVWQEKLPPLPERPWFTHDPQVERPLRIQAITNLLESQKEELQSLYSVASSPKAIAVGHGVWGMASSFGHQPLYRTEIEAARIALERCGFIRQAPCQIIAINDGSVVKLGSE